jgi:hypothetical protein
LACHQSQAGGCGSGENRLEIQESLEFPTLSRDDCPDVMFAFHDNEEIGPKMLARIAKVTGLKPEDL